MTSQLKLLSTALLLSMLAACSGGGSEIDPSGESVDPSGGSVGGGGGGGSEVDPNSGTPSQSFSIGGTLTGLAVDQRVTLRNEVADSYGTPGLYITLDSSYNGKSFTFDEFFICCNIGEVLDQTPYSVTVYVQPSDSDQTCLVSNGSGTVNGSMVTDVTIECVDSQYRKIDSDGDEVLSTASRWDCVQDYGNDLMWEVKSNDTASLRYKNWTYMNNTAINTPANWDPIEKGYDNGTCQASSSNSDGVTCNTEDYIAAVNSSELCGYTDWRLPNENELGSLLNCSSGVDCFKLHNSSQFAPLVDIRTFPNTSWFNRADLSPYWTSSTYGTFAKYISFLDGNVYDTYKSLSNHVRLVRDSQ